MIRITNMNPSRGRIAATFTAAVGDLVLPGCALIRRGDGYGLSVPRIGAPRASESQELKSEAMCKPRIAESLGAT